jgi:ubiquinone/menaquinone biosynthesis C-methylase UbiE/uncharacterized protein YbaR (Trm112 family)
MEKIKDLGVIKEIYQQGENIIQYLKRMNQEQHNSPETILISYDFQAGSYIDNFKKNKDFIERYCAAIADVIKKYISKFESIIEVGVGEATTLASVLKAMKNKPKYSYGFDISWSRIKYARSFIKSQAIDNNFLFVGDLFNIPIKDNSIDVVYTSHSMEPNGGREKEAITELYRIAKQYVILLEPCYELAGDEARNRMRTHGYITNLQQVILELKYNVLEFRLFDLYANPLNPTGLTVIKKNDHDDSKTENPLACPVTKTDLILDKGSYFSKESLLAYPVIDEIPCLLPGNAIVATHYTDSI